MGFNISQSEQELDRKSVVYMKECDYRLPRRVLPEVRYLLCALPWNDPSREAREGKVLGQAPTFRLVSIK